MKKIISILMFLILSFSTITLTGCAEKRIVLVPQTEYYPTFNTSDFNTSKKVHIDMWVETEEENGTIKEYLVADKDAMLNFIRNTKELRSNYNTLLREIKVFNAIITEQNDIQSKKKPIEIDSIKNSWYK